MQQQAAGHMGNASAVEMQVEFKQSGRRMAGRQQAAWWEEGGKRGEEGGRGGKGDRKCKGGEGGDTGGLRRAARVRGWKDGGGMQASWGNANTRGEMQGPNTGEGGCMWWQGSAVQQGDATSTKEVASEMGKRQH